MKAFITSEQLIRLRYWVTSLNQMEFGGFPSLLNLLNVLSVCKSTTTESLSDRQYKVAVAFYLANRGVQTEATLLATLKERSKFEAWVEFLGYSLENLQLDLVSLIGYEMIQCKDNGMTLNFSQGRISHPLSLESPGPNTVLASAEIASLFSDDTLPGAQEDLTRLAEQKDSTSLIQNILRRLEAVEEENKQLKQWLYQTTQQLAYVRDTTSNAIEEAKNELTHSLKVNLSQALVSLNHYSQRKEEEKSSSSKRSRVTPLEQSPQTSSSEEQSDGSMNVSDFFKAEESVPYPHHAQFFSPVLAGGQATSFPSSLTLDDFSIPKNGA